MNPVSVKNKVMEDEVPIREEPVVGSKKLFIVFGGIAAGIGMPPFEFYKSSKILNHNRIFIRDLRQSWYHSGLPSISDSIDGTRKHIETLITRYSPTETVMIGNSMGGFAAILFASLIGDIRAIAFAPQTFIGPYKRLRYHDNRWRAQIFRTYKRNLFNEKFYDLSKLNQSTKWEAEIFVSRASQLDLIHAMNLEDVPQVSIRVYDSGGHELVKHLRDSGELQDILINKKQRGVLGDRGDV